MAFQPDSNYQGRRFTADTSTFDIGLRRHMIGVYNYMMLGLVLSGLIAFYVSHSPALLQSIYESPMRIVIPFLPLAFVMVLSFGIARLSVVAAQLLFFAFSGVMGLSLSWIFIAYSQQSITEVFFITAGTFAATSLYGYTTKKSLTGMGSFMMMGLFGIIIAGLVNLFMHSPALDLGISVIAVIVFTGLTAYSTQAIRDNYSAAYGAESNTKLAILGALNLYLNFINLFMALLRLFGGRRG